MISSKKYVGVINRLGVSRSKGGNHSIYSLIQIDNEIIKNVRVRDSIDSYLNTGEKVELTVFRVPMTIQMKMILSIKSDRIKLRDSFGFILLGLLAFGFVYTLAAIIIAQFFFMSYSLEEIIRFMVYIGIIELIRSIVEYLRS